MQFRKLEIVRVAFSLVFLLSSVGLSQVEWDEHQLRQNFDGAQSIHAADIDGDGDEDIVAAAPYNNLLAWWENDGDQGFEEHAIDQNFAGACFPIPLDMDFDGDIDIVCSGRNGGVHWWENDGDQDFERRNIDNGHSCWEIHVYDIDGDDDWDVVAGGSRPSWYENDGDQNFDEHVLSQNFRDLRSVHADDVDSDGDVDIIGSDHSNRMCAWWENDGEQDFEEHVFTDNAPQAWDIMSYDLDQDGDVDILCAIEGRACIVWWENDGEEDFEEHVIDAECPVAGGVYVADIDMDGDIDVLGACYGGNTIEWYENDGEQDFEEHNIGRNFRNPWRVYPHDLDQDGDLDVLGAAWGGDELRWWENLLDPEVELGVDPEEFEFGGVDLVVPQRADLSIGYPVEEDNGINLNLAFQVLEGEDWLSVDPEEVLLEPNDTLIVEVVVSFPDNFDLGQYDGLIRILPNMVMRWSVEVPVTAVAVSGDGMLRGRVTDEETGRAVEGVGLTLEGFPYETNSNANGDYAFDGVAYWEYTLIAEKEDYLRHVVENVVVVEERETVVNIELLYAELSIDPEVIELSLAMNDMLELPLTMRNGGNGPLTWTVDRVFPCGGEIDPWVFRESFEAGDAVEDNRMGGIEFAGENFYIAGGNRGADQNFVYIFDREGNYVDRFDQFAESRYGMRDLAYDGELLWGIDGNTVYGFTTDGQLSTELNSPVRSARSIAWDPDLELLWISSVTTNIIGLDRDGNEQDQIDRPADTHIYGMSYFPEDPDGYRLYLFTSDGDWRQQVHKVNPENSESQLVGDLTDVEGARAGGLCITGVWDPYSWTFISMLDSPDIVAIWQLAPRTNWLLIEPMMGVVEPAQESELTVTLSTLGLPVDHEFEADLAFDHDGIGGETEVHVNLSVTGEGGLSQRTLHFVLGWNMASLNVDPPDHSIVEIMSPLVEQNLLILMKDAEGRFYNPEFGFINIPGWNAAEGYQVKVEDACELTVDGEVIPWDTPIDLSEGWQMVSYYPREPVDAIVGFSDVVDNLLIAKDNWGHFYNPEFGFSNIGDLREGQGYQLKMAADDQMVYTLGEEALAAITPPRSGRADIPACPGRVRRHFGTVTPTGSNMSLLVVVGSPLSPPLTRGVEGNPPPAPRGGSMGGAELAAFSQDGLLVGSGVFDEEGRCGVAIWGDDPTTEEIDGAVENEPVGFRLWNGTSEMELQANWIQGDGCYHTDDLAVVALNSQSPIATEFRLEKPYPNPFNNLVRLQFSLKDETKVHLVIYDPSGREMVEVVNSKLTAGRHSVYWDASGFPSGIYLARLSIPEAMQTVKMTLIK